MIHIKTEGSHLFITGDTYPLRSRIYAIGGCWDSDRRAWIVPAENRAEAAALRKLYECPDCDSWVTRETGICPASGEPH